MAATRPLERSPFSSPTRKRQRLLSSPDYDSQFPALSQEDFTAIEEIESRLSQTKKLNQGNDNDPQCSHSQSSDTNPFAISFSKPSSHAQPTKPTFGFTRASNVDTNQSEGWKEGDRSSSPEPPEEKDYSSWFDSGPSQAHAPMGFQTASFASASSLKETTSAAPIGFRTAGKGFIAPSAAALAKAQQKMKEIWGDDAPDTPDTSGENAFRTASSIETPVDSAQRGPLRSLGNAFSSVSTPCPPAVNKAPTSTSGFASASSTFTSPLVTKALDKHRPKPFKSPFLAQNKTPIPTTPINRSTAPSTSTHIGFSTARPPQSLSTPTANASFQTPAKPTGTASLAFSTPARSARNTHRFVTPFKKGMGPGETGRATLDTQVVAIRSSAVATPVTKRKVQCMFDLNRPHNRKSLLSSGLVPQRFTEEELKYYDLDYDELIRVTPETAVYYNFFSPSLTSHLSDSTPHTTTSSDFGANEAFQRLQSMNCNLAKKEWVVNHWSLILWKLAGMVALDPERECTGQRRWSRSEVWNQLLYRYERELNMGIRPALRRITTQDSPASSPIVLCVSNIIFPLAQEANGRTVELPPELEVTDGWYKLRAKIDAPLIRAVQKGTIRIGRKLAVAGARLDSERKDPLEVLEAYNSVKLIINGNASHLAPWHAKLGFQQGPFIATLRSLSPDGGLVPVIDVVVTNVHPIAYFEFSVDEQGRKKTEGPRNEAEEAKQLTRLNAKAKREAAESKLREAHEKKVRRYLGYAERLEQKAGGKLRGDEPPDSVENMYDELEEPEDAGPVLARATAHEAGWLARYIRDRIEKDQDRVRDEIEKELNVRSNPVTLLRR
ncbi:hypothetical protein VNI00_002109 [Paramarasmius palmivorus]|uniref:BRCA2 OB1 domain-containing protein n=1 Tax=Paramarasmius palmivorus TaxID=297713 RepID=A0AAW0E409_9AGAR